MNPYEAGELEPHKSRWYFKPETWWWIVYIVVLSLPPLLWLLGVLLRTSGIR